MYKLLKTGTKAEALRRAKLTLLESKGTSHPYYWAPFVLIGASESRFDPAQNKPAADDLRFKGASTWRKLFD
jgi:hypothetical protein